MAEQSLIVLLDDEVSIHVASLPGLFVLKLAAWRDRHQTNNKDAVDMTIVLQDYWEINLNRVASEHPDIFENPDFTVFTAGAQLMGRDIRALLAHDPILLSEICDQLHHEIEKKETSRLVQQVLEADRLRGYDEVRTALALLERELRE